MAAFVHRAHRRPFARVRFFGIALGALVLAGCLLAFSAGAHAFTIQTIAGNGELGFGGDGGPARSAKLNIPSGVAVTPAGAIIVADTYNSRVREIGLDGRIRTIAGTGVAGFSGDGGPAVDAELNHPRGVAVTPTGVIIIVDSGNNRIREIGLDGKIRTIAGNGQDGFSGDGGLAINAELNHPASVAVTPTGAIIVADTGNSRIREIGLDGKIRTIAGNGEAGFSGDGGPALGAEFDVPSGVAVTPSGVILIADTYNNRIRQIGLDGRITTIAGTGVAGSIGDGGPAISAELFRPDGVEVSSTGIITIADTENNRIRQIGLDGRITTIAGTGVTGFSGDGGPAISAELFSPNGIAVTPTNAIVVADTYNNRIRLLFSRRTQVLPLKDQAEMVIYREYRSAFQLLYRPVASFRVRFRHNPSDEAFRALLRITEILQPNHRWAQINRLPVDLIESITTHSPLFNWEEVSHKLLHP